MRNKTLAGIIALLLIAISAVAAPKGAGETGPRRWHTDYTLIVLEHGDEASRNAVVEALRAAGSQPSMSFDPGLIIGYVSDPQLQSVSHLPGVRLATKKPVPAPESITHDKRALLAIGYFNWVASGQADEALDHPAPGPPAPLEGDVAPGRAAAPPRAVAADSIGTNTTTFRRDHFYGSIVASIVLVEGPKWPWSAAQVQNTFNYVTDGISWWNSRLIQHFGVARPVTPSMFIIETHFLHQDYGEGAENFSFDRIDHAISAALDKACDTYHPDTPCSWRGVVGNDGVEAFNDDRRAARGATHAFTAVIFNNNAEGAFSSFPFSDTLHAAGYTNGLGGPSWVSLSAFGASTLPAIAAHETGHIFWACDEYKAVCNCNNCYTNGPRPGARNYNCEVLNACIPDSHKHGCIMHGGDANVAAFSALKQFDKLCPYTREQIGWWEPHCYEDVNWDRAGGDNTHWQGSYYNEIISPRFPIVHWADAADSVRDDGSQDHLDFTFPAGAPITDCLSARDHFSARWTRWVYFTGGGYEFTVDAKDGYNLLIDNVPDTAFPSQTSYAGPQVKNIGVSPGWHEITFEYFQTSAGGFAHLSWRFLASCPTALRAWLESWQSRPVCPDARFQMRTHMVGTAGTVTLKVRRNDGFVEAFPGVRLGADFIYPKAGHLPGRSTYEIVNVSDQFGCGGSIDPIVVSVDVSNAPHFADLDQVTVTNGANCGLHLEWPAATDCRGDGIVYNVYRLTDRKVLETCRTERFYDDQSATPDRIWSYYVYAEDKFPALGIDPKSCANGETSGEISGFKQPACAHSGTALTASGTANGYGAPMTLRAFLAGDGNPLANRTVSFELNGASVGNALTDLEGVATLVTVTNLPVATYPNGLTARFGGDSTYPAITATAAVSIPKGTPSISWTPADLVYGTPLGSAQLNATASAPGTFYYDPPAGTIFEAGDAPQLRVTFVPTDYTNYNSTAATASINVAKANQTITWNAPASVGYGTPVSYIQLNATVSVPGPDPASELAYFPVSGTVLPIGTHTLSVVAAETANYNGATATVPFTIVSCLPTITGQPQDGLVNNSIPVVLSVAANDGYLYRWYQGPLGNTQQPAGTGTSISVTPTADTTYWVRVQGTCNQWVDSRLAMVRVCVPPLAYANATNLFSYAGQSVAIGFNLWQGTDTVTHWYKGATGDTSQPLTNTSATIAVAPTVTTQYWARINNTCGSVDTQTINVDVCSPITITAQPASATILSGGSLTLSVTATITPGTVYYQWYQGPAGDTSLPVGTNAPTYATGPLTADSSYWVHIIRGACSIDSDVAAVTVCDLSAGVNSVMSHSGQTVNLTAYVYGARPEGAMNYEWFRGTAPDTSTPLAAGPWYPVYQVSPLTTTNYWVRVSDGTCTTNSNTATVTTCYPTITAQPQSSVVNSGTPTTLSVTATGDGIVYQWYQGAGTPVGTNSPTLTVSPTATTSYWVRVTGCGFADSSTVTLTVCQPATATTFYTSYQTYAGQSVWISVNVSGTPAPALQWFRGVSGDTSTPLSGGTANTILVAPTVVTQYWCRATNQCAIANGPTITVDACTAPVINTQPASVSTSYNGTATLSVAATASAGTLTYQWYKGASGDQSIPVGSGGTTFTTPQLTEDTQYWVRVTRGTCSTDSDAANVYVCQLSAGLTDRQTRSGQNVTLTAGVYGARDAATFSWYRGLAGDTSNPIAVGTYSGSLSVAPLTTTKYWVRVTDGTCTADSNAATVSTCIPTITTQPAGSTINSGTPTTLSVTATGDGLIYQWYQGAGTAIGTNSSTLTVSPTVTTSYWVRVTGCGYVDSATVTLTVCQPATATTSYTTYQTTAYQSVTIGVNIGGNPAPALQWYQGVSGNTSTPLAGKTTSSIVVAPSVTTQYWCRATNQCAVVNGPTITVDACTSPVINTQPASVAIPYNSATTLSVSATASAGTILYQWYEGASGDTSIPRGTAGSYTTPVLTADTQYWVRVTRGVCSSDSAAAAVSVCTLSASVSNLQSKSGQAVTLAASVGGARVTPSYTWYRGNAGDTSIPLGYVGSQVTVAPTTTTNYWVRVTDGTCTVNSNTATVSTCIPNIVTQPAGVLINSGQSTTLTITATGDGLAYQWYVGAAGTTTTPVGTNSPSLTVTPAATTTYWVRVSGCQVVNSSAATVTICALPSITYQPGPTYVNRNVNATVSVTATGTNLSYQWYLGNSGVTTTPVGTNSNVLTRTYPQTTNVWVRITGTCGSVNSNATTVSVYPPILTQPADTLTTRGTGATFSVYTDATPVSYQWYQGASGDFSHPVSGATNATFTSAALTADTQFFVRLTSGVATTDSTTATAFICPSPTVTVSNPYQTSGAWVTLSVDAPTGNDTYKWYKGNSGDTSVLVADTGSNNYLSVNPAATTNYWVRATNAQCSADSATYGVYVCTPAITSQPQNASITQGQTTRLSVAANGTPPLTYQWYTGNTSSATVISGATGSYVDVTPSATTTYYVRVTSNGWCAVNSNVVTVSVCQLPVVTNLWGGSWTNPGYLTSVSVTASGTNLTYQWYRGQTGDMSQPVFSNSSAPTFTASQSAYYWVKVSNGCGSVNSAAVLNSVYAYVSAPQSIAIPTGTHTTLTVYASGTYLSYQWYVNDLYHPIAGATGTSYTTPNLTVETSYYVTVKSGNAISYPYATVSMCTGPMIDYPWTQAYGGSCWNLGVSVNYQDAGNVTYTWYKGQSGDTSFPVGYNYYVSVCPTVTTGYWCRVSFADGSCYSDTGTLTVH
jgi:Ig-like domain CHU_C associated